MKIDAVEILVGIFVLVGLSCVGYMTVKLGKLEVFDSDTYVVKAKFSSVSGLKKWADVEISGILVGKVADLYIEPEDQYAVVEMKIRNDIKLSDDVIASVRTTGLIGDKFINLTPGGSEEFLKGGDFITETESAVSLEELIGKYVFGDAK